MQMIDLDKLTPQQIKELEQAALDRKEQAETSKREERQDYRELVDSEVRDNMTTLKAISLQLEKAKRTVYGNLQTLIAAKKELYDVKENQLSHTFTTRDGQMRIILGSKKLTGWDGTESAGVEKVKGYIRRLAADDAQKGLVDLVFGLLKPDKQGNLDIRRVMELYQMRDKVADHEFREGIDIIREAYAPRVSSVAIEAYERTGAAKQWEALPLSISSVNT